MDIETCYQSQLIKTGIESVNIYDPIEKPNIYLLPLYPVFEASRFDIPWAIRYRLEI